MWKKIKENKDIFLWLVFSLWLIFFPDTDPADLAQARHGYWNIHSPLHPYARFIVPIILGCGIWYRRQKSK